MDPIRVLLGPMPQMLRDILVATLSAQADMVLVGQRTAAPLAEAVAAHAAEVVVVGADRNDRPEEYVEAFRHRPQVRVLVIRSDGRTAAMHELLIRRQPLRELSPDAVVSAVRRSGRAARRGGGFGTEGES